MLVGPRKYVGPVCINQPARYQRSVNGGKTWHTIDAPLLRRMLRGIDADTAICRMSESGATFTLAHEKYRFVSAR
jgi:hypothetical protein